MNTTSSPSTAQISSIAASPAGSSSCTINTTSSASSARNAAGRTNGVPTTRRAGRVGRSARRPPTRWRRPRSTPADHDAAGTERERPPDESGVEEWQSHERGHAPQLAGAADVGDAVPRRRSVLGLDPVAVEAEAPEVVGDVGGHRARRRPRRRRRCRAACGCRSAVGDRICVRWATPPAACALAGRSPAPGPVVRSRGFVAHLGARFEGGPAAVASGGAEVLLDAAARSTWRCARRAHEPTFTRWAFHRPRGGRRRRLRSRRSVPRRCS